VQGFFSVQGFASGDHEQATAKMRSKTRSKRERVLAEREKIVSWPAWIERIEPHDPKTSRQGARPRPPLET
jgi:IS5 family transposase